MYTILSIYSLNNPDLTSNHSASKRGSHHLLHQEEFHSYSEMSSFQQWNANIPPLEQVYSSRGTFAFHRCVIFWKTREPAHNLRTSGIYPLAQLVP